MSRFKQTLATLQEMIDSGQLSVGDKLPPERTLAERLGVSRNSVREAIRALAEQGVLESRQGDGTYVREQDEAMLRASFEQAFAAQAKRLEDVLQFRRMVEPDMAALAAANATEREIEEMKILVFDQQRRQLAGADDTDLDEAFHMLLARASGNEVLAAAMAALADMVAESRSEHLQSPRRRHDSLESHLRIIDAVEKRDATACKRLMEEHLERIEADVLGAAPDAVQ
ncbi:GntR domain protein [Desulfovibrio sp. X2]|uniref:FadR/GntR family transcriptional regulator n=1 Tax=Desulfovibrio sp. X2 TaxID=941449 RepID=UPI000358E467|nr:FCD domain-containing protein [Desulfovibrio sp. X2]EPR42784.1 GntR domain protein [Desulfovibrio sp. X2]